LRVVFDTNVLVSAFIARGASSELFEHCLRNHDIVASRYILDELDAVLHRKLGFPGSVVNEALDFLAGQLVLVEPEPLDGPISRDPSDDPVIACAVATSADCLVTGDEDLIVLKDYQGIPIFRPSDFWRFEKKRLGRKGKG
jgi:putative PIN family toxin of toxin-antitoxin system